MSLLANYRRIAIAATVAILSCWPLPSLAEKSISGMLTDFIEGRSVEFGPKGTLLFGGVTDHLMSRCGGDLSLTTSERVRLVDFMTTAATRASLGGRYSDPDLGKGVGSQVGGMAIYALGGSQAKGVQCGASATAVLKRIAGNLAAQRTKSSRFVESCKPFHGASRCGCLAEIGQSVFPGFRDRSYSRDAVYGIIQSNPLHGLMITMKCGIMEY